MNNLKAELLKAGLKDKEAIVYLHLLSNGPSSIREIAQKTQINRGSVHEALKSLRLNQLVTFYELGKRQNYMAEDPKELIDFLERQKKDVEEKLTDINVIVPELRSIYSMIADRPIVKYYEGAIGSSKILKDILETVRNKNLSEYYMYSPSEGFIYEDYPDFSKDRSNLNIFVKAISFKNKGSEYGKDERKFLPKAESLPTYTFIYGGKVAMISKDEHNAQRGVVIEDNHLYETQLVIFENLWKNL